MKSSRIYFAQVCRQDELDAGEFQQSQRNWKSANEKLTRTTLGEVLLAHLQNGLIVSRRRSALKEPQA